MTDERKPEKPETPGMAEVSAKFVHEAEAVTTTLPPSGSQPGDPLTALGEQWQEAYRNWQEFDTAGESHEESLAREKRRGALGKIAWEIEDQAAELPAQSLDGVLVQLRMAGAHYHLMERDGEKWHDKYAHLTWQAWKGLERLVGVVNPQDVLLERLAIDYYAAYIARDAASNAREEVEHQAEKSDSEAIRIEGVPHASGGPDRLFLPFLFDSLGTFTPSREQVSQYYNTDDLTETVMRHLEKYGERCVAALEAAGWPEKYAEHERVEQRVNALFDQMVQTPAQGFRGIAAKIKGLVFPHEFAFLRDGELDDFDDQINTEMLVSLVADIERLSKGVASVALASVTEPEDAVVALRQHWENVRAERDQLEIRDDNDPNDPGLQEDERLYGVQSSIEDAIAATPTHTAAGVAAKLLQLQRDDTEFDGNAPWRPAAFRTALKALGRGTMPAIEDPILALKREWEARYELLDEHRSGDDDDDSDEARQPFYDRLAETEVQILRTRATTPAGIAVKLILWARQHCTADELSGLSWNRKSIEGDPHDLDRLPVMSALLDLERMSQGVVTGTIKEPAIDEPLLVLEQRWREAVKAYEAAGIDTEEARLTEEIEAKHEILATPARSIAGVLVKLAIYASSQPRADTHPIDQLPLGDLDLDQAAVAGAMRDLKRMAHTTTVAETPPEKDAALFDALTEYDRLVAISQDLERRKDVFRPGIPEAKKADEAYEAAYDQTTEAWTRARDIPATTQAGVIAKLQGAVRFMTDLGEDQLFEAEWLAIKADVLNLGGPAPGHLAGGETATRTVCGTVPAGEITSAAKDNGLPPLDGETAVRVEELANQIVDLNQGVRRLLDCDLEEIPTTGQVLTSEIDRRLVRLINLLDDRDEEVRS